eukprot:TRINITY_DN16565_c0_g1_i2.p1 TRINITY_DN16565_c0_g1~~TRINITY_DN16565_c0_g1_i2.p1  ORF type:complete len:291 (+),score=151.46 TRINITY_DN16565_c0_g1_i2:101-874(+)
MQAKPEWRGASIFTGDAANECQALFDQRWAEARKKDKDKGGKDKGEKDDSNKMVSQNDVLFIMRGIGMNPTQEELEELIKSMVPGDADEKKDDKKKKKGEQEKKDDKKKKEEEEADKKKDSLPPEDVPKYQVEEIKVNLEKVYRNQRRCEEDIIEALRVFDRKNEGRIQLKDLIKELTENGDDVLSHGFGGEVQELKRLFGEGQAPDGSDANLDAWITFTDFAKTMQEGKRPEPVKPPTPPPEEGGSRRGSAAAPAT